MKEHGKTLAGFHKLNIKGTTNPLLARLDDNKKVLGRVYAKITAFHP